MTRALKAVAEKLSASKSINIIVHRNPDGDAIGSAVALKKALSSKEVTISCTTDVAEVFKRIIADLSFSCKLQPNADVYIIVDCSEAHRTGFANELKSLNRQKICVIDHHKTGNLPKQAGLAIISDCHCSTTEIIDDLLRELRVKMLPEIATALLLGIFTDTGGFRHSNTTVQTLKRASHLISNGGNIQKITQTFFQRLSSTQRKLWGKVLAGIEVNKWGMAVAKIDKHVFVDTGANVEDAFGLANNVALVNEARASLLLIEQEDGWRGILRTRHHQINIGRLAKLLGGKGQPKAAGFTATKTIFSDIINNSH
jgi:phosphoesterase RecJ-like protein